ncbi:sensor histidine kinase [Halalkalibacter kiskunsagensis]|uniref:Sensor histidine kinase n=1 Tax=Halalkalibacter kiskunsagensis TaxID=1548599 RepID=A0ABV6KG58_9BACI
MVLFNKVKERYSIRKRIIMLALFSTLIPLVVFGMFTFIYLNKVFENQVSETTSNFLSVLDLNINTFVDDIENISNNIFLSNDIQEYLSYHDINPKHYMLETASKNFLNSITIVNRPYLNAIYLGNEHHEFLKINRGESNRDNNIFDQLVNTGVYDQLLQSDWKGMWFKEDEMNLLEGSQNPLMFGRVLRELSTSGELGISIIVLDQFVFENMFRNVTTTGDILILDDTNTIYFSGNEEYYSTNQVVDILHEYDDNDFVIETIDQTKYILNFHTNENTNWKIVSIIPYQSIVKDINDIRMLAVFLLFVSLILSMLGATLITKKITKQLALLKDLVKKMEKREYLSNNKFDNLDEFGKVGNRFVELYNRNNKLTVQLYEAQLKEKEAELLALQSHINPHFLYNTLNSIYWMAVKVKAKKIAKMAISLSKLFKLTLNDGNHITTIAKEVEQVKSYLEIQNIRFDNKIKYFIDVDPSIFDEEIIKLVLQPIVENAIQHGFEPLGGEGELTIRGFKKDNNITFEISDNGIGFNMEDEQTNKQGYALKNINERIKLHYGKQYGLEIESEVNDGTKVTLTIGLKKGHSAIA